ncbi:hypothetical protein [Operophtera brumata reovirus]|uniref:hypothetical protein n=1 Tax=Operophtera brumata reovirus TaxID=352248 RepID=UPI00005D683E|nr:hypothetical protein [Operophtera brumata reovirus]ABB17213.1 unknown [Operophtera brumata reovirus]
MSLQQSITRRSLVAVDTLLQGEVMHRQFGSTTMLNQLAHTNNFVTLLGYNFREGIEYRFDISRDVNLITYTVTRTNAGDTSSLQLIENNVLSLRSGQARPIIQQLHQTLEHFMNDMKLIYQQLPNNTNVLQAMTTNLGLTDGAPIQHLQFLSGVYLLTGGSKFIKEVTALYVLGRFELRTLFQSFDVMDVLGTDRPRIRPIIQNVEDRQEQRLGMKNSYQLFSWSTMPVKITTYGTYRVRAEREVDETQDFIPVNLLAQPEQPNQSPSLQSLPKPKRQAEDQRSRPTRAGLPTEPIDRLLECEKMLRIAARSVTYTPILDDITDSMGVADLAYDMYEGNIEKVWSQAEKDGMVVPVSYTTEHDKVTQLLIDSKAFGTHSTVEHIRPVLIAMSLMMVQANIEDVNIITKLETALSPVVGFKEVHEKWVASLNWSGCLK